MASSDVIKNFRRSFDDSKTSLIKTSQATATPLVQRNIDPLAPNVRSYLILGRRGSGKTSFIEQLCSSTPDRVWMQLVASTVGPNSSLVAASLIWLEMLEHFKAKISDLISAESPYMRYSPILQSERLISLKKCLSELQNLAKQIFTAQEGEIQNHTIKDGSSHNVSATVLGLAPPTLAVSGKGQTAFSKQVTTNIRANGDLRSVLDRIRPSFQNALVQAARLRSGMTLVLDDFDHLGEETQDEVLDYIEPLASSGAVTIILTCEPSSAHRLSNLRDRGGSKSFAPTHSCLVIDFDKGLRDYKDFRSYAEALISERAKSVSHELGDGWTTRDEAFDHLIVSSMGLSRSLLNLAKASFGEDYRFLETPKILEAAKEIARLEVQSIPSEGPVRELFSALCEHCKKSNCGVFTIPYSQELQVDLCRIEDKGIIHRIKSAGGSDEYLLHPGYCLLNNIPFPKLWQQNTLQAKSLVFNKNSSSVAQA